MTINTPQTPSEQDAAEVRDTFFSLSKQYRDVAYLFADNLERDGLLKQDVDAPKIAEQLFRNTAVAGSPVYEFIRYHWRSEVDHIRFVEQCTIAMVEIMSVQNAGTEIRRPIVFAAIRAAADALQVAGRRIVV